MTNVISCLNTVKNRIHEAESAADIPTGTVKLLAVSKKQPSQKIVDAYNAGQRDFGENYLQDAIPKIEELRHLDIIWHFIGPLQSNKTKNVAENFDWIHSIDRLKIAQRLNSQRPEDMPPINACLQVNISNEDAKSGITPDQLYDLATAISEMQNVKLRGLMAIPEATDDGEKLKSQFFLLKDCFDKLVDKGFELDTLSMGMSGDLELAISCGSNMVRIGTSIFGIRTK